MKRVLPFLLLVGTGCIRPASARRQIEWPDESTTQLVAPSMEAGAALAAAAAVREMVKRNPFPHLFNGCSSPEQGLNAVVFKEPTSGLYFVVLEQRFDRCGGPSGRVLDWWYEYAVTPQGEVVAEAPPWGGEAPAPSPLPTPPPPEQAPAPTVPPQGTGVETPPPPQQPAPAPLPSPTPSEPQPLNVSARQYRAGPRLHSA
ncbi:hypothetical protein ACLESD_39100 [Pyxidicoccus sp. 3LFB2]